MGQALVAVRASSVNVIDTRVRSGMMGVLAGKKFPRIPGADVAGVVKAVPAGATGLSVGDAVFGAVDPFRGGAFAEVAAVPVGQLAPKPDSLTFAEAAALPVAGVAALTALRKLGKVTAGQRVLVHGGSGAVGLFAIQIARRLGAHVTAVSGASGLDAMRQAGADVVIDYRAPDAASFSSPFDVILDASGALPFARGKAALSPRGVLVEPSPTIPLVIGSTLANLFRGRKHMALMSVPKRADLEELAREVADGSLRPLVARTFNLSEAEKALAFMEKGGVVGKVVVTVGSG